MDEFKNLKRVAMNELRKLDSQYADKNDFSQADAERYKCLMMGLEKQLRCEEIMEKMEWDEDSGNEISGRRGRAMNGQYISRDVMNSRQSYDDGYSRGYSDAMSHNDMGSGRHHPFYMPDGRQW